MCRSARSSSVPRPLLAAALAAAFVGLAPAPAVGQGGLGSVTVTTITVKDGSGLAFPVPYPVEAVVPMAPNEVALDELDEFFVVDPAGNPVLTQVEPVMYWTGYDNSVRQLKVLFMASVPGGSPTEGGYRYQDYTLKRGSPPAQTSPLSYQVVAWEQTTSKPSIVEVTTGPLRFRVKKNGFNLLDQVWLDRDGDSVFDASEQLVSSSADNGAVMVKGANDVRIRNADQGEVDIDLEEVGPVRIVLRIDIPTGDVPGSSVENVYGSRIRLTAYADYAHVDVAYSLRNARNEPTDGSGTPQGKVLSFKSFGLGAELEGLDSNSVVTFGAMAAAPYQETVGTGNWFSLRHDGHDSFAVLKNGSPVAGQGQQGQGTVSEGWFDVTGTRGGLAISLRHANLQYPSALRIDPFDAYDTDPRSMVAEVLPTFQSTAAHPLIAGGLCGINPYPGCNPSYPAGYPTTSNPHWLDDMTQKTFELRHHFHEPELAVNQIRRVARLFEKPPVCYVPFERHCDTHATFDTGGMARADRRPGDDPDVDGDNFETRNVLDFVGLQSCPADADAYYGWFNFLMVDQRRNQGQGGGHPYSAHEMHNRDPETAYYYRAFARHGADLRPVHVDRFEYTGDGQGDENRFTVGHRNSECHWTYRLGAANPIYPAGTQPLMINPFDNQHIWIDHIRDVYALTGDPVLGDFLVHMGQLLRKRLDVYAAGQVGASSLSDRGEAARKLGQTLNACVIAGQISKDADLRTQIQQGVFGLRKAQNKEWGFISMDSANQCQSLFDNEYMVKIWQDGYLARGLAAAMYDVRNSYVRMETFRTLFGLAHLGARHTYNADASGAHLYLPHWTFVVEPYAHDASCWNYSLTGTDDYGNTRVFVDVPAYVFLKTGQADPFWSTLAAGYGYGVPWDGDDGPGGYKFRLVDKALVDHPSPGALPAGIQDVDVDLTTGKLTWTAPAGAGRYEIRFSTRPLVEEADWTAATGTPAWPRQHCYPKVNTGNCTLASSPPAVDPFATPNDHAGFWAATLIDDGDMVPQSSGQPEELDVCSILEEHAGETLHFAITYYDRDPWLPGEVTMSRLSNVDSVTIPSSHTCP